MPVGCVNSLIPMTTLFSAAPVSKVPFQLFLPIDCVIGKTSSLIACSRSRLGRNELKALGGASPPRTKQDMGSIALLSPVRANHRTTQELGAAKVSYLSADTCILALQ